MSRAEVVRPSTRPAEEHDPSAPPIDVVVVAYGNAATIAATVEQAMTIPGCASVVVVDNGTDDSAAVATDAGAVALRRPDNPGFGTSQNLGVAATESPFVLLLNPDAVPDPEGIRTGVEVMVERPAVAAVQGVITSRRTGRPERSMGPDLTWRHLIGRALALRHLLGAAFGRRLARSTGVSDVVHRLPDAAVEVETLAATALLVRRSAFDDVGGFDDGYFLYGEDLELCRRLRDGGWTLIGLPVPWATHADGSTADSSFSRELSWWRGTMRYAARWWSTGTMAMAMVAAALMWARLSIRHPSATGVVFRALIASPLRERRRRPGRTQPSSG